MAFATQQICSRKSASTMRFDAEEPVKLWCDHSEGFESGSRAWELDVGEWERASGTALADAVKYKVMMNMAPIILRNNLQLWAYANSAAVRTALLQWCFSSRNFGANPTVSDGNGTGADVDNKMQVDSRRRAKSNTKTRKDIARTTKGNTNSTHINTCKNCGRPRRWATDCRRPGGGAYDNSISNNDTQRKAKANKWTLWKRPSLLKQHQPCRILHHHRARWELFRAIQTWNRKVGSWV